ncbi:MAG TPA: UDP-N-acetylmuramoyl-tripeptide--D-alanyl-D-alanine ligase [Candidatus Paceibacterota bacterium]
MKNYLTRYHPRYIRALVYLLQASEYNAHDYLALVRRTRDFRHVERRKQLKKTHKALALLVSAWALAVIAALTIIFGVTGGDEIANLFAVVVLLGFPHVLPYLLLLPLFVIELVQLPIEAFLIAQAKAKLRKHPAFKIAIAGSYGKTSMREILKTVLSEGPSTSLDGARNKSLRAGKKVAAPGGSENTPIGIARFVSRLRGDEEILIFELGEYYRGDIKQLAQMVRPDLGVITGVNEAHLSKFKTVDAAANTIFELAEFLGGKPLYVNAENEIAREKAGTGPILFSREGVFPIAGGWKVVAAETSLDGTSCALEHEGERINVQSKLLGLHNVGPLAAAVHIAKRLGLTNQEIETGIAHTKPFAHRLERRDDPSGVITLDDSYNGNPDGVEAVIAFLASIENHRRWYVTPGLVEMGHRSEAIHKEIGKQLAQAGIEKVVLIRNSVTPWIEKGLRENSFGGDIVWFDDALNCYNSLPHMTVAGDVVVLQNDWPDQYA